MFRHFHNAYGAHRHTDTIAKPPYVNAKQRAQHDSDCGFVRNDEYISSIIGVLDFFKDKRTISGNFNSILSSGGGIPSRICEPSNVVIVKLAINFFRILSLPLTESHFFQPIMELYL